MLKAEADFASDCIWVRTLVIFGPGPAASAISFSARSFFAVRICSFFVSLDRGFTFVKIVPQQIIVKCDRHQWQTTHQRNLVVFLSNVLLIDTNSINPYTAIMEPANDTRHYVSSCLPVTFPSIDSSVCPSSLSSCNSWGS